MRTINRYFGAPMLALAAAILAASGFAQRYDVVFRGGEVLDGTGAPAVRADVAVQGDVIARVGDLRGVEAARIIDITGLTLTPGFIDLHSHADGAGEGGLRSPDARRRAAPNLVAQGVTTVVVNQDGRSPLDIRRQKELLEERRFGPNAVLLVGHNSVRARVLDRDFQRAAAPDEMAEMARLVREGMDAGAYGLSAGLEYVPGIWSTTEELIELVKVIVPYGGVYIVHERGSGADPMWFVPSRDQGPAASMLDSVEETIRIAETTGAVAVATHIKARGANYWGKSQAIIERIEAARRRGVNIFADQYPYTTSGSDGGVILLPDWIIDAAGGDDEDSSPERRDYAELLREALLDVETAAKVALDVDHEIVRRGGPENIVIFEHPNPAYIGKSLAELALAAEIPPREMVYKLQFEGFTDRFGGARLRGFSMSEQDVEAFAAQPWCATASDAGIALPIDGPVHARFYGTFPRKLRHYAIERRVLSIEQAVYGMTGLPAQILRFAHRGLIREGFAADLAVIDLDAIRDTTTFFDPHRYPEGVEFVLINGQFVVDRGQLTWALPGTVLTPHNSQSFNTTHSSNES